MLYEHMFMLPQPILDILRGRCAGNRASTTSTHIEHMDTSAKNGAGQRLGHIAAEIRNMWLVLLYIYREYERQRLDYDKRIKQRDEHIALAISSLGATIRTSNEATAAALQELTTAVGQHRDALTVFLGNQIDHQNSQVDFALSGVTSAQRDNNRLIEEALRRLNTQTATPLTTPTPPRLGTGPLTPPRQRPDA